MKKYLVGADEVGRGCLFGPVVAAAVILGNNNNFELKDSKKLSEKKESYYSVKSKEMQSKFLLVEHLSRK